MAIGLNFREVSMLLIVVALMSLKCDILRVKAQFLVNPLWDISNNNIQPCFVNTTGNVTLFRGESRDHSCTLQVSSPEGSLIQIQINGSLNDDADTLSYLYYKRTDIPLLCHNKYVDFGELNEPCKSVINDRNVEVTLQGFVSLYISYVMTSTDTSEQCPDFLEGNMEHLDDNVDKRSDCKNMQGYNTVIMCMFYGDTCRIELKPNCDAILGSRKVTYQCDNNDESQNIRGLIVYPNDLLGLDIAFNGLLAVQDRCFEDLGKLRFLTLDFNELKSLPPEVFHTLNSLHDLGLALNQITQLNTGAFDSLSNLYKLNLMGNKLRSLPNEIFRNTISLKKLYLSWNQITELNVGVFDTLNNLYILTLYRNRLRSLPDGIFRNTNRLNELVLYSNQITELNVGVFDSLSNLYTLDLGGNRLRSLPDEIFRKMTSLNELYLSWNQITHLNVGVFDSLSNLYTLDLRGNRLKSLPDEIFRNTTSLNELNLESNQINQFNVHVFDTLSNVYILSLKDNRLKSLPDQIFENINTVKYLFLSENQITQMNIGVFDSLSSLYVLYLSLNKLNSLPDEIFRNTTSLNSLFLNENRITQLNVGVFDRLSNLYTLSLSSNKLTSLPNEIFRNTTSLNELYLELNQITELNVGVFDSLSNLYELNLLGNMISSLPDKIFQNNSNLKYLVLSGNQITELNVRVFDSFSNLYTLDLSHNMLSSLPDERFKNIATLSTLMLNDNLLSYLPEMTFQNMTGLMSLSLGENQLTELNVRVFQYLPRLLWVTIGNNKLRALVDGVFQNLTNLRRLILSSNVINLLSAHCFQGLKKLQFLDLGNNKLTTLQEKRFLILKQLETLKLGFNQITQLNQGCFQGLEKLTKLYLDGNMLSSLPDDRFLDVTTLESLHLSHNPIVQLDLIFCTALQRLKSLFLFNDVTQELHVPENTYYMLERLKEFSLFFNVPYSGNGTFDWKILNRLGNMELFHFGITNEQLLPNILHNIPRIALRELHLTHMNQMVRLVPGMFMNFDNVYLLNISKNGLVELNKGDFSGLNNLQILHAQGNKLNSLHKDIFQSLRQLSQVYVEDNHLTQLDVSVIFTSIHVESELVADILRKLDLSDNKVTGIHVSSKEKLRDTEIVLQNNPLRSITHNSFSFLGGGSYVLVNQHEICECYVPNNVQCTATDSRSPYLTCDRLLSDRALVVAMWLIGLNALCGNLFVLIWRIKETPTNKVNSLLLSNLAASDFLMGLYMLIIATADIYFGDQFPMYSESWISGITCRSAGALAIISSEASVFFVTLISIDRFICIRFPFSTKKITKGVAIRLAGLAWSVAILLGIVPSILVRKHFKFYGHSHVCMGLPLALTTDYKSETRNVYRVAAGGAYVLYESSINEFEGLSNGLYFSVAVFLGLNCICYLIILGCYIEIVRAVRKSAKRLGRSPDMNEQLRLTTKVTAIVATDFCCWFPIIILGILVQTRVITLPPSVFAWCVTFVLPINSAINPYLYTIGEIISKWREK